jgi:endonuclease/exonuclease/phosphatase family metal-dependent hydrolase
MRTRKLLLALAGLLPALFTGAVGNDDSLSVIQVMTYNIRYDARADEEAGWGWSQRKEELCRFISFCSPDVFGIQEGLVDQVKYLDQKLQVYAWIGAGRDDGREAGEFVAIFYKKDRFDVLESGNFWLSETPEEPGLKGWDAACTRMVTWGKFRDRQNGKVFFFFNTHFDHVGTVARMESARLLLGKIQEVAGGDCCFLAGDLNATPDSEPVDLLLNPAKHHLEGVDGLQDAREAALQKLGPAYTYTGFDACKSEEQRIDYIFTKKGVRVLEYAVIAQQIGYRYLSDHLPVFARLAF